MLIFSFFFNLCMLLWTDRCLLTETGRKIEAENPKALSYVREVLGCMHSEALKKKKKVPCYFIKIKQRYITRSGILRNLVQLNHNRSDEALPLTHLA